MDLTTLDITKNAFVWYWYLNFDIIAIWAIVGITNCWVLLILPGIPQTYPNLVSQHVFLLPIWLPVNPQIPTRRILPVAAPHSKVCDAPRRRVAWVNDKTPRRWIERQGIFVENRLEFRKFVVEMNVSENLMNGHSWHSFTWIFIPSINEWFQRDSFLDNFVSCIFSIYKHDANMKVMKLSPGSEWVQGLFVGAQPQQSRHQHPRGDLCCGPIVVPDVVILGLKGGLKGLISAEQLCLWSTTWPSSDFDPNTNRHFLTYTPGSCKIAGLVDW